MNCGRKDFEPCGTVRKCNTPQRTLEKGTKNNNKKKSQRSNRFGFLGGMVVILIIVVVVMCVRV